MKTRLALALARRLLDDLPGGAFLVALAPVSDPAGVLPAVARALELGDDAGELAPRLAARLGQRRSLLVLDNFEQILPGGSAVAELLECARDLRVLVTSQAPLHVRGETVVTLDALAPEAATALFTERARAATPGWSATADEAAAVADVCERVGRLPLAVELAAARVAVLAPSELLRRLEASSDVLRNVARDAPERHRNLRATFEWSHGLLAPEHQVAVRPPRRVRGPGPAGRGGGRWGQRTHSRRSRRWWTSRWCDASSRRPTAGGSRCRRRCATSAATSWRLRPSTTQCGAATPSTSSPSRASRGSGSRSPRPRQRRLLAIDGGDPPGAAVGGRPRRGALSPAGRRARPWPRPPRPRRRADRVRRARRLPARRDGSLDHQLPRVRAAHSRPIQRGGDDDRARDRVGPPSGRPARARPRAAQPLLDRRCRRPGALGRDRAGEPGASARLRRPGPGAARSDRPRADAAQPLAPGGREGGHGRVARPGRCQVHHRRPGLHACA